MPATQPPPESSVAGHETPVPQPEPSQGAESAAPDKTSPNRGAVVKVWRALRRRGERHKDKTLARHEPVTIVPETVGLPPRRPGFFRRHLLFFIFAFLPTALSIAYFGFYASDVYVSESRYVVRSPSQKSMGQTGLGAILQGSTGLSGFARAPDDVHAVSEYILSRDALMSLDEQLDVRSMWGSKAVDILQRFNPLGWDNSIEALYEYYPKRVHTRVDEKSGITTLTVSSFSPEQSRETNQTLIREAEQLVNVLNERGRNDLIVFATGEVKIAEDKAKAAALTLSEFRNTQAVVDPEKQTMLHFEQVARLQEELIRTRGQLTQLKVFAPDSPHPPALELRAKTLEAEIAAETEKITGGENSLASKAAEYQRLQLEREFADQQLAIAMAALESARNEAQRQQLYLEAIAKPNLPDTAIFPRRIFGVVATFLLGLVAWGIAALLLAGVREHPQ